MRVRQSGSNHENSQNIIRNQLNPGEKIVWSATPYSVLNHAKVYWLQGVSGILGFTFAIFWLAQVLNIPNDQSGIGLLFPIFGIFILSFMFFQMMTPVYRAIEAKNTYYGITNERVLIVKNLLWKKTWWHNIDSLGHAETTSNALGVGNIIFERKRVGFGSASSVVPIGFIGIEDVQNIETLIRKQMNVKR